MFGRRGTENSSQREGLSGPSCLRIRSLTAVSDEEEGGGSVVAGLIYLRHCKRQTPLAQDDAMRVCRLDIA